MGLIGSRSDFAPETLWRNWTCGECWRFYERGKIVLVSRRNGRVRKIVCSEACREEFEQRFWEGKAAVRAYTKGEEEREETFGGEG